MIEATSCGGVLIFRGKILLLYKSYNSKNNGWVLPKGTVEEGESHEETAVREVREETGANGTIVEYIGKSHYNFNTFHDHVNKDVHWFLMKGESYYCKPQRSESFTDAGFYKYHEAYHLLKFDNERMMLEKAYARFHEMKREGTW